MRALNCQNFFRTTQDEEILRRILDTHTSVVTALNDYRYKGGGEKEEEEEEEEEEDQEVVAAAAAAGSQGAGVQPPIKDADV